MDFMDKRTLVAIILSLLVLIGSQYLLPKPAPQAPQKTETTPELLKKETAPPPATLPATEGSTEVKDVIVETDYYIATLTSRGGSIKAFELKSYRDKKGSDVSLLKNPEVLPALALGINTDNFGLSQVNFSLEGASLALKNNQRGSIVFSYSSPQLSIKRTYTFYADQYKFDLRDEVTGIPEYWITLGSDFGIYDATDRTAPHIGPVLLKDTDRIELSAKKLDEPKSFGGEGIRWIAQEDKYFFAAIAPSGQVREAKAWKIKNTPVLALKVQSGVNNFLMYAGPKDYDRLQALHVSLEHVIDFGFFSILARPLFWVLKFFYKFLGNYGWAIVLLTIIVRIPFIPLINKGQKSMRKMQELQPKLNEIKEKYKKDPQKMQRETMEMYKKYKVNPVGGCLPMILQIPVFYALYKVLMISIELRGAPFLFWITDLSTKDPYYILPIIMGITMVVQQKMTPSSLDPTQNKMMMLMPVVFTFLFLNFASGLVLYWLTNNILSIAQQFYTNKKISQQNK
ncbi:MAG TPA: hypothetical protein DCP92_08580 [Nitrospiraceae bacterium]|nr:hypothetical protein [Nitrospiraceae bacterium]